MALSDTARRQAPPPELCREAAAWFEEFGLEIVSMALRSVSREAPCPEHCEEDDISLFLQAKLEDEIRKHRVPFFVIFQKYVYNDRDVAAGLHAKDSLKVDLALRRMDQEGDVYLSIEAKILVEESLRSWERKRQARRYVQEGMRKFVDGRYARKMPVGVMLGYVRTGVPRRLIKDINQCIIEDDLVCLQQLKLCPRPLKRMPDHYLSLHPRDRATFRLHHLLAKI